MYTKTNKEIYNDFYNVEFIRNPRLVDSQFTIIALDYFDFIYATKKNTFKECMVSESDIASEAYQSVGLFRKGYNDDNSDPFILDENKPFFSILQVTLTPESYCDYDNFSIQDIEDDIIELENEIEYARQKYIKMNDNIKENKFKITYKVYNAINTMDFCIVLSTNYMEFSLFLANSIRRLKTKGKNKCFKYSIYTVMGISKDFNCKVNDVYIGKNSVLVNRVHLKRKMYTDMCELNDENDTDTHCLPGRYDLTIRVNEENRIKQILPILLKYITLSFPNNGDNNIYKDLISENNISDNNMICWLIKNDYAEYMNARVFFDAKVSLKVDNESIDEEDIHYYSRIHSKKIENTFDEVKKAAEKAEKDYTLLKGYFDKLHSIIHIYSALYSRYDTHISIKMLGTYLISFMEQLKLHINMMIEGYVKAKDIAINLAWGINYLQQFIKVVTSVNTSSFDAPKYETEKDECCIVKLSIAYSEFLNDIFKAYREKRSNNSDKDKDKDKEVAFFPKYNPVVIPYMQNGEDDFMMTTLLAQNMFDVKDWGKAKKDWEIYVKENESLMFIICQNMDKYKDIPYLIRSSFHELGHYCNGMTRRDRNGDLIEIFAGEIAKDIINKYIVLAGLDYCTALTVLNISKVMQTFYASVCSNLIKYFNTNLSEYMECHSSMIKEKFVDVLAELTHIYVDCENEKGYKNGIGENISYNCKYVFGLEYAQEESENSILETSRRIINNLIMLCSKLENSNNEEYMKIAKIKDLCMCSKDITSEEIAGLVSAMRKQIADIDLNKYWWDGFPKMETELVECVRDIQQCLEQLRKCAIYFYQCKETEKLNNTFMVLEKQFNELTELEKVVKAKNELIQSIMDDYFIILIENIQTYGRIVIYLMRHILSCILI